MMRRRIALLLTFFISTTFLVSAHAIAAAPAAPSAPTIGTILIGNQQVTVPYTLGSSNGSAITKVEYSSDGGATWSTTTSSPITIGSLTNGITYTIKVRATNAIGTGAVASKTAKPLGATNTITFTSPAPMTYGDADQKLTASSPANNVAFTTSTSSVCSIVSGTVRPLKAGTCTVIAASIATSYYAAATSVSKSFAIAKSQQFITFPQPSDMTAVESDQSISASSNSGVVTITSSTKSVCTIVSNAIHPIIPGVCTVTAASATNTQYLVASTVSRSITISKASQVITFPSPASMFVYGANQTLTATSPAGAVTYVSTTTSVCTVVSGAIHAVNAGVCSITASNAGSTKYFAATSVTVNVTISYAPTITSLSTLSNERGTLVVVYGTYLTDATFTIAGVAATVSAGASATSATLTVPSTAAIGAGSIIAFTSTGTASASFEVLKTSATVTLGSLSATYDGAAHAATATTNPSGKAVTFTYNGSATTPTDAGTYSVVGTINDSTYRGSASGTLVIAQATATVNLGGLSATFNGSAHGATATTNPSGKPVTFTYDGSTAAPIAVGSYAVVGTVNDTNYSGSASGTLVIASATPAPITYACTSNSDQECGPLSALSVTSAGTARSVFNGSVALTTGQDVTFSFTSSAVDAGKHLQVHWYDLSAGMTTSVASVAGGNPWSTTLCYPDGAGTTQCQIALDSSGSVTFTVHFTGNTVGQSFKYDMLANGYNSGYVSATFTGTGASASPLPTPTSTATGPWTIRQTVFDNSNSTDDPGSAATWVSNNWYHSGLQYRVVNTNVGATTHVAYHVTDGSGQSAVCLLVKFALGKEFSSSNAHVKVGDTVANGTVGVDGATPVIISAVTDSSGNVAFDIVNTDTTPSNLLYSQITAFVTDPGTDTIDITTIVYSQSSSAASPSASPSIGSLLWSDEFTGTSGSAPSSSNWVADVGDGCAAPNNNCGWGNGERQSYQASANKLDGTGVLKITPRSGTGSGLSCYYGACSYISGKLTTRGKAAFTYGYLEAKIKSPTGGGTWPAFWMLNTDLFATPTPIAWPTSGEIDIFEVLDNTNYGNYTNWGTAHYADSGGGHVQGPNSNTITPGYNLSAGFHTYGILWLPTSITWYLDGVPYQTLRKSDNPTANWPFGAKADGTLPKFYAILNVAMQSGATIGNPMQVDYVRYYSANGYGTVTH